MKTKNLISIYFVIIVVTKSFSCSCRSLNPLPYPNIISYNNYDLILTAEINSIDSCNKVHVTIKELIKGNVSTKNLIIFNDRTLPYTCNSSCDVYFKQDSTYLFYILKDNQNKLINITCSPTHILKNDNPNTKETLYLLNQIKNNSNADVVYLKHSDGRKMYYGKLSNNSPNGLWMLYDKNGKLSSKGNFENGVQNGLWIIYYSEKKYKYQKGIFENGSKEGKWRYYDDTNKEIGYTLYLENHEQKTEWY